MNSCLEKFSSSFSITSSSSKSLRRWIELQREILECFIGINLSQYCEHFTLFIPFTNLAQQGDIFVHFKRTCVKKKQIIQSYHQIKKLVSTFFYT